MDSLHDRLCRVSPWSDARLIHRKIAEDAVGRRSRRKTGFASLLMIVGIIRCQPTVRRQAKLPVSSAAGWEEIVGSSLEL